MAGTQLQTLNEKEGVMSEALQFLLERNTHEVKLESGLVVEIALQQLAELLVHGDVPLPILAKMDKAATDGELPDLTAEELQRVRTFNVNAAAGILRKVSGFEVPEEERQAAVLELSDSEFNELVAYATRMKDPDQGEE
jgi:hypothetical protein